MQHYTRGGPLSQIRNLHSEKDPAPDRGLWGWGPMKSHLHTPPKGKGYQDVPRKTGSIVQAALISQLYDFDLVVSPNNPEKTIMWAKEEDIERARACPVILAQMINKELVQDTDTVYLLGPLPTPYYGSYAFVQDGENLVLYGYEQLPQSARAHKFERVRAKIIELAERAKPDDIEHMWVNATLLHRSVANEDEYHVFLQNTISNILKASDREKQESYDNQLKMLQLYRSHILMIDRLLQLSDYPQRFQEIAIMMQELAKEYYDFHQTQIAPKVTQGSSALELQYTITPTKKPIIIPLPSLTSWYQGRFPSAEHFRGLAQSFGPRITHSYWNTEESKEQYLRAPNGATLAVRGENEHEQKALHQLIDGGMGVEGIKYLTAILAAYNLQTGAVERKLDANVTLRQLLIFMGREKHADDIDEQRKLMHYILYLARTWVTAPEKEQVTQKRGRPKTISREYTPLLVLEALKSDERGGIKIPSNIEFHLGKEFWDQMFGSHQHFFTLPTMLILGYHSKDQPQEICLAFYLANMLNLNSGLFSVHFPVLLLQTGLQDQEDIDKGHDRTRAAIRVLYALEQLERDNLIQREPHQDVDTALACAYYQGETAYTHNRQKADRLAEITIKRIQANYAYLAELDTAQIQAKKRASLQSLLIRVEHNTITFKSGTLINPQIEKRKAGRQAAIEARERAQEAAAKRKGKGAKRY